MTQAAIGYGTLFKIRTSTGPDVFTTIGEQASVTPFGIAVDSIDASHEESPSAWREFIPGLKDGGEVSLEIHYVPGGTAEATLLASLRTTQVCRVVFPSGAQANFSAFITEMSAETPIDDKMVMSVTLKLTGAITMSAASAPSNSTKPAISGVAQVGVLLTAFDGVWANEPTSFTYAWEADGTPIGGATAKTYTPIIGQIGDVITCVVTGTNSAGSASAESAGTAVVIAA
jgi:predicted secreted protein